MKEMNPRIALTGARGRLGTELCSLLPGLIPLHRPEFDLTQPDTLAPALDACRPQVLIHAAAYTDVRKAEEERAECWRVNVEGTRHLVREAIRRGIHLVHISTDYVFEGTRGGYRETEVPGPVRNYYALTKLVAEESVRVSPRHLVIRTSFRPREWPYPVAFTDVYTSQDYVDLIAPEIALAVRHLEEIPYDTLHIATERKSVYELARRRKPDVQPGSKRETPVSLPDDISLDISRWTELKQRWKEKA
ncbi:MAG: NAD(P)-dependent oxidoreductase [Armatimonadetes bacterium]|nr:NAD(P)-dependent oxidoreductase [Armatimonadota bacterium]